MASFTALYDACVLYPAPIRDLMMELALTDLFRAKWSALIHGEWMAALARDRPDLKSSIIERTRSLMDCNVRDCLVTGYEFIIPALSLPDPNDRHVLAAAIRGRADVIVTYNLKDFPQETLADFDIEINHPDDFVSYLLDLSPARVLSAIQKIRSRLKRPPMSAQEYLDALARHKLIETVAVLREYEDTI